MTNAPDWVWSPRQVPGASYWYAHTDQWRYCTPGFDELASPVGSQQFTGKYMLDLLILATGWSVLYL